MQEITHRNFGLLIAYIVPGFVALIGFSIWSPLVKSWLVTGTACESLPTVGGFLYVTLASVAAGMTVSCIRFIVIDSLLWSLGVRRPVWNDRSLETKLNAKNSLIEYHYRYYQFHANMVISMVIVFAAHRLPSLTSLPDVWIDWGIAVLVILFLITAANNLRRYYGRSARLLGEITGESHEQRSPSRKQHHQAHQTQGVARRGETRHRLQARR